MPIFKNNRKFFKIIFILQIISIFLTSSCALKNFHKYDDINFMQAKNQLKELIIPKDVNLPMKNEEYTIPYQDQDLEKKNYDISPPV
ncbi:hypothetical protein D9V74_00460 [Buchnera aphidicola (Macrosiphoniella sanborni)]|uniref:Outer membrane protein assembly factor BamC n=1 Tax=Buchnera aphidicola (Macrosiphoniella sanborni) TaxID=1241865 RepID=A0A4D6Y240_9GAMM|nr:hypothetical protein [Buchnera aphidicola]QCI23662.1 hypothetical protein D9V74_00460 [Buchnera aphidicola (Macrosiphoniella sanborni)]